MNKHFRTDKIYNIAYLIAVVSLLILWLPTGIHHMINSKEFNESMLRQPISQFFANLLTNLVPTAELMIGLLLTHELSRKFGLISSLFLLTTFSAYIIIGLLGLYGEIPCECAAIIQGTSWIQQLFINLVFIVINTFAFLIHLKLHSKQNIRENFVEGHPSAK